MVVVVDSDDVVSVTDLQPVSALQDLHKECIVTLCRYPFGRINRIHPDNRGWIFLERFITMVKCAMLDSVSAAEVIITSSESLLAYIQEGADRLREAGWEPIHRLPSDRQREG